MSEKRKSLVASEKVAATFTAEKGGTLRVLGNISEGSRWMAARDELHIVYWQDGMARIRDALDRCAGSRRRSCAARGPKHSTTKMIRFANILFPRHIPKYPQMRAVESLQI
jgi:hypothetical protein